MGVTVKEIGKGPNGENLFKYTMKNENGTELSVINFGCIITNFLFAGKDGKVRDVILGYEDVKDYFTDDKCFGAIVGPVANRTANASFVIDGTEYKLEVNDNGRNNLHTARLGSLQKRVWDAETGDNSVTFTIDKADMDLGLPGNLKAKVVYTLTEEDEIKIDYDVTTDKKTIINMTNHTYFNLNGHDSGSILNESIVFNADSFLPVDDESIPSGEIKKVAGTPMDFTEAKKIGEMLDMNYNCDHIERKTDSLIKASGVMKAASIKNSRQTINFIKGCSASKGAESEEVLLLDDDVINKSLPVILCTEEDVEGEHGASIGQPDEDELYYLRSRGLDDETILGMLSSAKILSAAARIDHEPTVRIIKDYLGISEEE